MVSTTNVSMGNLTLGFNFEMVENVVFPFKGSSGSTISPIFKFTLLYGKLNFLIHSKVIKFDIEQLSNNNHTASSLFHSSETLTVIVLSKAKEVFLFFEILSQL